VEGQPEHLQIFNKNFPVLDSRKPFCILCSLHGTVLNISYISDAELLSLKQNLMQSYFSAIRISWMALHTKINICCEAMQKVMAAKTQYTCSEDSTIMAPSDKKLYYLLFLVLAVRSKTSGYTFT
jgi:hypothetical protein